MTNKVLWISDLDILGSGYQGISTQLAQGLLLCGYDVKLIGLNYKREEHPFGFHIIPAVGFHDATAIIHNLIQKWDFDVLVCALDIPHQEQLLQYLTQKLPQRRFKYVGIMAVEAGPLCMSWSYVLMAMNKAFIISEYGTRQAQEAGVSHASHIQIGIDTNIWKIPTADEKVKLRKSLGIEDDEFVVLSVGDNQERKNPHKMIEVFAEFAQGKKTKFIHVTREFNLAGGRLKEYAQELGIIRDYVLFERGIPVNQLWGIYAMSDAFLLLSKAEGLGMPLLEAMAVGLPIVATNCTAINELLSENRGLLVDFEYQHRDCFGNGWRYWASKDHAVRLLQDVYEHGFDTSFAREYVEKRTWDIPVSQLDDALKLLTTAK
jgi:glycosyltransferase involved in cell wall biosynthesis